MFCVFFNHFSSQPTAHSDSLRERSETVDVTTAARAGPLTHPQHSVTICFPTFSHQCKTYSHICKSTLFISLLSTQISESHKKQNCEQSREKIHTLNKIVFILGQLHQRGAVLRTFGLFKWEHTRHRVRLCARDDRFYDTVDVFTALILSVLLTANNLQRTRSSFQNINLYNCEVF